MIKAILKDSAVGIIVAGALSLMGAAYVYFSGLWPQLLQVLIQIWSFTTSSTATPNWLLGFMSIPCVFLTIAILIECKVKILKSKGIPTYENYTEDSFFGLRWRWEIPRGEIKGLNCFCPKCDYQILPKVITSNGEPNFYGGFYITYKFKYLCDSCGYSLYSDIDDNNEFEQKVRLTIQKKIRTGEWRST